MPERTLIIKNGTIVTMNKKREYIKADIFIKDDRIIDIRPNLEANAEKVIDADGMIIIPGLIQTHIHLTQSLFKGQADDLELLDWLKKKIWPLEAVHTYESNYISAKLGIAELIKGGTTSIIDMETVNHTEAAFEAVLGSGIRAHMGKCMMDYGKDLPDSLMEDTQNSIKESIRILKKWHQKGNGRIQYAFAPRFVVSCSEELLLKVKDLAEEYGVMVHTHASENQSEIALVQKDRKMRNIAYLHKLGLTGENLILAHCIWLDEEEMNILADTGTKVSHCPNSNLKLASGIAKIPELLKMGVNVSMGADGAPCNNNLDIFGEMRSAALIHKARLLDPTTMSAHTVFEMATIEGAKAMGLESEIGSIEKGKKADLAILNLKNIHNAPYENVDIISQLVYSASSKDVMTTIVDGNILMENRQLKTIDEDAVISESNRILKEQLKKIKIL
ncbi:5'-deoxyadenosine deaminase [Crassaminicella thermophila]|uniref:5-methylthioadenosine/S-adenosylhomocysteine deaminase n=1 Tax=Crassaminicella thermophila TaxID=2599308 RepID=A0A5C0SGS1_CRATE|nr:5'-deoxyadenosine deaminase [Crassaminicella thermophila]QEK13162.1 5'-deoxyadenosine deaminase [Crassaminicella thermophila]